MLSHLQQAASTGAAAHGPSIFRLQLGQLTARLPRPQRIRPVIDRSSHQVITHPTTTTLVIFAILVILAILASLMFKA